MSEILVKTNIMTQCVNSEQAMIKKLNSLADEIEMVQRNLSFNVKSRARINSQLSSLSKVTQRNANHMSSLASVLSNAAGIYSSAEKRIAQNANGVASTSSKKENSSSTSNSGSNNNATDNNDWDMTKIWKKILSLFGAFGAVGGIPSLINSIFENNPIDIGKGLLKLVGPGAKMAYKLTGKSDAKWSEILFGAGKTVEKGFSANWAKQIEGFKFFSSKTKGMTAAEISSHNTGALAKWGGVFLTALGSFVGNAKEYNYNYSNADMYVETAAETGFSVLSTMGVTAAVAAALPATAPVWLAALAGTAIVSVVDIAVDHFTGQDLKEWVADGAVWAGEKISKGFESAKNWVGDKVGGIGRTVAGWFK